MVHLASPPSEEGAPPKDYTYDVVVIGAGIHGLSIARELTLRSHRVAILARDLPTDLDSGGFASPWAGANWCSFAGDNVREQEWDRRTFVEMREWSREEGAGEFVEEIDFTSYWEEDRPGPIQEPWFKELVPAYANISPSDLPPNVSGGYTWRSLIFNPPGLLAHYHAYLLSHSVPFHRVRLSSLDEAYNHPSVGRVKVVVNASALGARVLLGVEDEKVHPIRGQTVLVKAEGFKRCVMFSRKAPEEGKPTSNVIDPEASQPVYIIPRAGPLHHVILGGTSQPNNYSTLPEPSTAERILRECYKLAPDLAGPNGKSWRDIEVVGHGVGLRPGRVGGCRLELEEKVVGPRREAGDVVRLEGTKGAEWMKPRSKEVEERQVGCVHAYGIGPAGYQSSRGVAHEAANLVEAYLNKVNRV